MRGSRKDFLSGLTDPGLIGAVTIMISAVALMVALQANQGLPFIPVYDVNAHVEDGAELTKGADVRIGGGRIGRVVDLEAIPGTKERPAYARIGMALEKDRELPVDSTITIRPLSLLGGKYVAVTPGKSSQVIPPGGTLPLRQAVRQTELFEAFNIFDADTTRGLRGTISSLGDALAGRGTAINETLVSLRRLMPPLQRVLDTLASPRTELAAFIRGAAATTGALAPVASELASMTEAGATTFAALEAAGPELEDAIEQLAPTEVIATRALLRATPVLADGAALARDIRPGTALLPQASKRLANAVDATTPVLERAPGVLGPLRTTLAAFDSAATEARSSGALDGLLGAVASLGDTLRVLTPPQVYCNIGGLWARNVPSSLSEGDESGTWLTAVFMSAPTQTFQAQGPSADLHATPYPNENENECEAGNEPFLEGRQIGNPAGNQSRTTELTAPPPGVLDRADDAGLILRGAGR